MKKSNFRIRMEFNDDEQIVYIPQRWVLTWFDIRDEEGNVRTFPSKFQANEFLITFTKSSDRNIEFKLDGNA